MKTADDLLAFPSEEETQELLDNLPDAVTDVLSLNISSILEAMSRLHGTHAHWSSRYAAAAGHRLAAKSAKEVGLAVLRRDSRTYLQERQGKVTDKVVETKALTTVRYLELCRAEAEAETQFLQCRGILDAIVTKREALRALSFILRNETELAETHLSVAQYAVSDSDLGRKKVPRRKKP